MDLSLTETQELLKRGVEEFIERETPLSSVVSLQQSERGYSDAIWRTAAEVGWLGMLTPEAYGGSGSSFMDAAVVFQALGAGAIPGPLLSSGVIAPLVIEALGTEAQREQYLPALARGELVATFALTEPEWGWGVDRVQLRAEASGDGYRLNGTKLFVYDAHAADVLLVAARTSEGVRVFVVPATAAGVEVRRLEGLFSAECQVRLTGVQVPASAMLGRTDGGGTAAALEAALLRATPILCAYQVGGAQTAFELSVDYSRRRRQFGQPIGRFQHVQNHIVQLVNHLDGARWTTYEALWKLDAGKPGVEVSAHLAKVCASEGFVHAVNYAHEVHAGVGVMHEYGLTLFTRLSRSLYFALGDPKWHRQRLAALLPDHELSEVA
ncbi:MAG: acyl-CoA/acyl-ACP dehydrogenase [Dehalococcoidia bacterium]|nr:acyl-CoA/acyl-ACP dehydrogenase [Dehalococcoidia bacterium]